MESNLEDLDATNPLTQPSISFALPNMSSSEWRSNSDFNSAGMQVVYQISNLTLNAIFPTYDQFLDYAQNYEQLLNITTVDWERVVLENKGVLGFVLGCILFILLLTCWGVGWIFCKCCCGDKGCCMACLRSKDSDDLISAKLEQKRDKCKRNFCGVLFASIIVVFMFGLVCCFVTNEQMRMSVDRMPEEVDNSLADVDIYLNTTERQISTLFIDNYQLLSTTLNHILDQSGEIIKNGLSKRTGAQALNNLTEIVDTVEEVRNNVINVERTSKSLKDKVDRLKNGLTDSKSRLLLLLDQCQSQKCLDLRNMPEIRSLRVQNDFQNALAMYYPKLPNMTDILRDLGLLLGTDVRRSIEEGRRAFNSLGQTIKNEIEPVLPEIRRMISETGSELGEISKSLTKALESIPVDTARDQVHESEIIIKKYAPYRYYAVLGVCLTLSFIFTLLTLGIFVGFCGRQPGSDYSNECCSRKTGSSFINCGIFFIFLTGGILMAVALVHFVLAGLLTQGICEAVYAQDNRTQTAFNLPTLRIESKYNYEVPPYHEIVKECKNGASAYIAFRLAPVYNIEDITMLSDRFKKKAKQLANKVTLPDDATERIVFLSGEAKRQLANFSESKITKIHFNKFANHLEESIVSVDLRDVINRFNETIEDEENFDMPQEVRIRLQNEILILESLQEKILTPMVAEVKKAADSLRFLFHQQKDLAQRIKSVADSADKAQRSLHSSGARQQVRQLAHEFEGEFVKHVDDYANFTYISIRDSVGHCEPLYNSLNSTTTTFCHKIGSPLSAFWFSLTCLLILFVPLLLVGMILARLYRKYKYIGYESGRRQKRGRNATAGGNNGGSGDQPTSHSSSAAAHSRYHPSRFEDTSQNLESILRRDATRSSSSQQLHPSSSRRSTNLRFIDTPTTNNSQHDYCSAGAGGLLAWNAFLGEDDNEIHTSYPPPPSYSVAVRYAKIVQHEEEIPLQSSTSPTTTSAETTIAPESGDDSTMYDDDDVTLSSEGAWGSQLVFNNHHTPPASGEYERPPPYYYPGPAN
ncbi:prominin-1-A isoform X3 [Folsomia candida]|uniref:prominin-1-A isoform X3 n=1 Tax=Folsomia candida TaxID=158441 RepID=UPI0016052035|nr:prominin-1-A isoform X3 [Folsomia candida]